jgi:gas vesicle protein
LAGIAIGGTADILFAPEKGSTTRKQITPYYKQDNAAGFKQVKS